MRTQPAWPVPAMIPLGKASVLTAGNYVCGPTMESGSVLVSASGAVYWFTTSGIPISEVQRT